MDVKIIMKIYPQQKQVNISHQVFQFLQYFPLKAQKIIIMYTTKNYMKKFCRSLREHAMEIINFEEKKIKLLTKEQQKSYQNSKICYIFEEKYQDKHAHDNTGHISSHSFYTGKQRGAAYSIWKYSVPKNLPIVFHNGSNYDYHFIIKLLAEKLEK